MLGAFFNDALVGVGALNRDPYTSEQGFGRLRRIYVTRSARRHGVGAALVRRLLEDAGGVFRVVRLRAASSEAAALYLRFGFIAVKEQIRHACESAWPLKRHWNCPVALQVRAAPRAVGSLIAERSGARLAAFMR